MSKGTSRMMSTSRLQRSEYFSPTHEPTAPPASRGVDNDRRFDRALIRLYPGNATTIHSDPRCPDALVDRQPPGLRAACKGPCRLDGIDVARVRLQHTAVDAVEIDHRETVVNLVPSELLHSNSHRALHLHDLPTGIQRLETQQSQVAHLIEAAVPADFPIRIRKHLDGPVRKLNRKRVRIERPNRCRGVARADRCERSLLQQDNGTESQLGKEVGRTDTQNPAPNDDSVSSIRHTRTPKRLIEADACKYDDP